MAPFPIQLPPTLQTQALFDTGASCLCISQMLFDHLLEDHNVKIKLKQMSLKVGQADGTSLLPRGVVMLQVRLHTHTFSHPFVVCVKLQQDMLLGFDFTEHFSVGIDWDTQDIPYLQQKGHHLLNSVNFQPMTVNSRHNTMVGINQIDVNVTDDQPKTDKTRLIMINRVMIPSHHIAVFYSKPTTDVYIDPNTICSTRQNDLLTLEYPEILILEILHSFDPKNM